MTRIASLLPLLVAAVVRAAPVAPRGGSDGSDGDGELGQAMAMAIPRTIIQTGPKDAARRDAHWQSYQSSLRSMNPGFAYLYFDDEAALSFVDEHFGDTELPRIYRDAPKFVLKADLFRYAAVKVLGGFYMDMDMMAKAPLEPLVTARHGAVFPKEWWRSDGAYRKIYGEGRSCPDDEEHWQVRACALEAALRCARLFRLSVCACLSVSLSVCLCLCLCLCICLYLCLSLRRQVGNYAFAAAPNHPFVADALDEAMARAARLIERTAEDETAAISDDDILLSTGPYMLSELYHEGRRHGKYADVAHIRGDDDAPSRRRSYGGNDWHKFGRYAEHMLTHSWVTSARRRMQDTYGTYGTEIDYDCILQCPGVDVIEDVYMLEDEMWDLYYGTELGECIEQCLDTYGVGDPTYGTDPSEVGPETEISGPGDSTRVVPDDSESGAVATVSASLVSFRAVASLALLFGGAMLG
jgi:mannosyltransferase OCH1-like enzyme